MTESVSGAQSDGGPSNVRVRVEGGLPRADLLYVRGRIASLARYTRRPPEDARLTLRVGAASRTARRFYIADATVLVRGTVLIAHATGPNAHAATDAVCDRLRRQIRRVVGAQVARRSERSTTGEPSSDAGVDAPHRSAERLKPPEQREIVTVRKVPDVAETTLGAVAELFEREYAFSLFCHARTAEDAVVYRREDDEVGLLHPPGSPLSQEKEIVVPESSRYSEPLTVVAARSELDVLNHRFLYFIDAADSRGKVLYLRRDGDYGLVEPG
jgi:ribosome-associated translation inhibitor RaiA